MRVILTPIGDLTYPVGIYLTLTKTAVADISVCCPYPNGNVGLSRRAALTELRAAKTAFTSKTYKYKDIATLNNLEFLPLIIESSGRLHPKFEDFMIQF